MKKVFPFFILIILVLAIPLHALDIRKGVIVTSNIYLLTEIMATMFVFFLFIRSKTFQNLYDNEANVWQKIKAIILFSLLGIYSSGIGIPTTSNIRDLAPLMAGFIGGPVVGIATGFITGIYRFLQGGFTQIASSLAPLIAGCFAGFSSKALKADNPYDLVIIMTAAIETLHMLLILLISKPFYESFILVQSIIFLSIIINGIGIFVFAYILWNYSESKENN